MEPGGESATRERLQLIQVARKNLDPRAQSAADGGQKG